MATIDQDLIRPKTKVFRKVTIGVNTITLEAFGSEGAGFYPFAFYVIRVDRYGYINVEGDFRFYNRAGFKTSSEFGIYPTSGIPMGEPRCMMCQETYEGALEGIHGYVVYDMYYNA